LLFDTSQFEIDTKRVIQNLRETITLGNLRDVIRRLGNELILDNLLEIVKTGYSMSLGWTEKADITLQLYETLYRKGYLQLEAGVSPADWTEGLIKSGRFYARVRQLKDEDNIIITSEGISFTINFSQLERDIFYLELVRLSGRDYINSLLKIIDEEFNNETFKDKLKEFIDSIMKLYRE
jgi:hypothetical protein